ncbi:PA2779 family protein [Ramlibacter humi]|uniref:PA2779 family protein n=1 Tax=Ramlibacter humi TaxID=2530451 RepID=A0A4Z0CAA7_9BURK|nr:PA2779 family protein [Ramlibacter humi]TFZ07934.1 hypothetical protein EZ216_01855 [Ramlibacter humi]
MSWSPFIRCACWSLAAALALQAAPARAAMIGAEAAAAATENAPTPAGQEREKVRRFLESTALQERLRSLGVDGLNAAARVDAMSQDEVHALAERIDALPAGGALSDRDWILVLLVALLVIVAL